MKICFDVDGTLIDYDDNPREDIITLLRKFSYQFEIIVWSGGGEKYAYHIVDKLGLWPYVEYCLTKDALPPEDTAFTVDDLPDVDFGVPNLYVGPKKWDEDMWDKVIEQRERVMARTTITPWPSSDASPLPQ